MFRNLFIKFIGFFSNPILKDLDKLKMKVHKNLLLESLNKTKYNSQLNSINDLTEVEYKIFSQFVEDGILSWLINEIENIPKNFIEFGCSDYDEANTRLILEEKNWSGLIIDNDRNNIEKIKKQEYFWKHDIVAICENIQQDNINTILSKNFKFRETGILSIDIDGNDYWVWKNIKNINPYIVVCEYNAILGDLNALTIPYKPNFSRTFEHYSNLYFGCSILALINLAKEKGYTFLGTNLNGVNAFFIRSDLSKKVLKKIKFINAYPSKIRESRNQKNQLNFIDISQRINEIKDMEFINLKSNKLVKIEELRELNSKEWSEYKPKMLSNEILMR